MSNIYHILNQAFFSFAADLLARVPHIIAAIVTFAIFWGAARIVHRVAHVVPTRKARRKVFLARIAEAVLFGIGIVVALTVLGVDLAGLLTGLGLVAVGLSLTLQDIIVNFIAGLELLGRAPFELGELIELQGARGRVRDVGARATIIEAEDGTRISIPNRELLNKILTIRSVPAREIVAWELSLKPAVDVVAFATEARELMDDLPGATQPCTLSVIAIKTNEIQIRIACGVGPKANRFSLYEEGMRRLAQLAQTKAA